MCVSVRRRLLGVGMMVAGWLWSGAAMASIIETAGPVQMDAPAPPSVKLGDLTSNTEIFAFTEQTGLILPSDFNLKVNITTAGTYESNASLTPGKIAAGTEVDSYFLHTDTVSGNHVFDATFTFSTPILGVIVLSNALNLSDSVLGAPGTLYQTGDMSRGLELGPDKDYVTLSSDLKTLTVQFDTHANLDELRVVTAAAVVTPEPSSIVIAGGGLLFLSLAFRWRQRRSA